MWITFPIIIRYIFGIAHTHTCDELPHEALLSATDDTLIFGSQYGSHFFKIIYTYDDVNQIFQQYSIHILHCSQTRYKLTHQVLLSATDDMLIFGFWYELHFF